MGCGSSAAADPAPGQVQTPPPTAAPAAAPAAAGNQKAQVHSPFQYGEANAVSGSGSSDKGPAWQDEEVPVRVEAAAAAVVAPAKTTSHLDHTQDEVVDVDKLAEIPDGGAGAMVADADATVAAPEPPVQVGGTWGAVDKLQGTKLSFSVDEVEALNTKFKSKMDADSSGSLDLAEFQLQVRQ